MTDGGGSLAAGAGAGTNHDGSCRLLVTAPEVADVGHDDVNACGGNAADLLDRATDLAFERANARDFLHEGGQAEGADIVEEFISGIGAVGQAAFGKQQTRLAGHADRHLDACPVCTDGEIYAGFGQRDADLVEVGGLQTDVEGLVGRLIDVKRGTKNEGERNHANP